MMRWKLKYQTMSHSWHISVSTPEINLLNSSWQFKQTTFTTVMVLLITNEVARVKTLLQQYWRLETHVTFVSNNSLQTHLINTLGHIVMTLKSCFNTTVYSFYILPMRFNPLGIQTQQNRSSSMVCQSLEVREIELCIGFSLHNKNRIVWCIDWKEGEQM